VTYISGESDPLSGQRSPH